MIRFVVRLTALLASFALVSFPQEILLDAFPDQMRKPISDAALSRLFLEHAAAFEYQARFNEAQGESGEAFRNHLQRRYGLAGDELSRIAQIAVDFNNQLNQLRSEQRSIATRFRAEHFPNQANIAVHSLPRLPAELLATQNQIEFLSRHARDEIKAALGHSRFSEFSSNLRRRDSFHDDFPENLQPSAREIPARGTYAYSSIDFDRSTNQVTAYAKTDVDGTLLPYYEAALNVTINGPNSGRNYASSCPKPIAGTFVCQFAANFSDYMIHAEHGVNLRVQDSNNENWIDPAAYEYVASLDIAQPFEMQFIGQGPSQSISEQSLVLGNTFVSSDWP